MHLITVTQWPFWLHRCMLVKNCSHHVCYKNWGAVEKIPVYSIVNNWCEPHIVNSPPPLPHPERGHSTAKIKQIYIVLLISPQRTKAKGIALPSTVNGCSPSPLRTRGTGVWTWHHTNPLSYVASGAKPVHVQPRKQSSQNAAACTTMPLDICTACVFRSIYFFLGNYEN